MTTSKRSTKPQKRRKAATSPKPSKAIGTQRQASGESAYLSRLAELGVNLRGEGRDVYSHHFPADDARAEEARQALAAYRHTLRGSPVETTPKLIDRLRSLRQECLDELAALQSLRSSGRNVANTQFVRDLHGSLRFMGLSDKPAEPPGPLSLDETIAHLDAMLGWLDRQIPTDAKPPVPADPSQRGCLPRNRQWLAWYEAEGEPTFHSPAKIRDKWNALPDAARQAIAPEAWQPLPKLKSAACDIVKKGIKEAKRDRDS